jgi:hypothetical protein
MNIVFFSSEPVHLIPNDGIDGKSEGIDVGLHQVGNTNEHQTGK